MEVIRVESIEEDSGSDDPDAPVRRVWTSDDSDDDGDAIVPLPPILPLQADAFEVFDGRRWRSYDDAELSVAIWFNRERKRLTRCGTKGRHRRYKCVSLRLCVWFRVLTIHASAFLDVLLAHSA